MARGVLYNTQLNSSSFVRVFVCVQMYAHVHVCTWKLEVILHHSLLHFLSHFLSLDMKLTDSSRLADQ